VRRKIEDSDYFLGIWEPEDDSKTLSLSLAF